MSDGDRPRPSEVLFHIGGPFVPVPLCGSQTWTVLVHYNSVDEHGNSVVFFCPECLRIHREQHPLTGGTRHQATGTQGSSDPRRRT